MKMLSKTKLLGLWVLVVMAAFVLTACSKSATQTEGSSGSNQGSEVKELSGEIIIDGSSTVFPVSEAVAEEFGKLYPRVQIPVGFSGTGGGFKKFTKGETDISNASRPIKDSEIADAQENGIEYIELKIAYDGLSVLVKNPMTGWIV